MHTQPARLIPAIVPEIPFTDATALIGDGDALRARMAMDGYLYLPRFLDPVPLLRARADILDLCRRAGWLAADTPLMDGISNGTQVVEGNDAFKPVYRQIIRLASFNACSVAPELLALLADLFGSDVLPHPRNICRLAFPGCGQPTQPHQDFHYIRGTTETYTTWIPTADVPDDLGGLAVLEGSHRLGFLPHQRTVGAGGAGVITDGLGPWHGGNYRLGDVLIMHSYTIHGARDHHDPHRVRLSFDFRYQPKTEPIDPSSLCYHLEDQPRQV